jgi:hypothetical protein
MPTPRQHPMTEKILPKHGGITVTFTHIEDLKRRRGVKGHTHIPINRALTPPVTTLPVDNTGNQTVQVFMYGNGPPQVKGNCGEVAGANVEAFLSFGQGKPGWTEILFNTNALISQYETQSGGDNGLDEQDVIDILTAGVGGVATAKIVPGASFDIDPSNTPLMQYALDNGFLVIMGFACPDAFLDNFEQGAVFSGTGIPNPNQGHFVVLADVGGPATTSNGINLNTFYSTWCWASWVWCAATWVNSVQPQCFINFTCTGFNAQGYDSKGVHITVRAANWQAITDMAIPASVINAYPPPSSPVVIPPVDPPPATPPATPFAGLFSMLPNGDGTFTYMIPNVAAQTIDNNPGNGEAVAWYSPGSPVPGTLTAEQLASVERLSTLNWAQILKDVEAILAIIGPLIPSSKPETKPSKPPGVVAKAVSAFLIAASLIAGTATVSFAQGQPNVIHLQVPLAPTAVAPVAKSVDLQAMTARVKALHAKAKADRALAASLSAQYQALDSEVTGFEAEYP